MTPQERLAAFLETWSELMRALPDDYSCHMTCEEAETAADLYRAEGYPGVADEILANHAAHDTSEDAHYAGAAP